MLFGPAAGRAPLRRCWVLALALVVLPLVPRSAVAAPAVGPPPAAVAPEAGSPTTSTSTPATAPVDGGREPGLGASDVVLPIVLAALLFLALLGPPHGLSHSHRHWHSG
jgi:hypothetical protein